MYLCRTHFGNGKLAPNRGYVLVETIVSKSVHTSITMFKDLQ